MSRRFLGNTKLFPFEVMMQEIPTAVQIAREDRRAFVRYVNLLNRFLREKDLDIIIERVTGEIHNMMFDEFLFKSARHKSDFYTAYNRYITSVGNEKVKNERIAVLYLLSAEERLSNMLRNFAAGKSNSLAGAVGGIGEAGYSLYHTARYILGLPSQICAEDITEDGIISDGVLCILINGLLLAEYGNAALTGEYKKAAQHLKTPHREKSHRYSYKDQAIRVKM
ncbi:MAG: hypothetical protein Q4C12_01675 [Clostridia bacterium]|nr:hypothetical protein [Clostridia bacterium]